jgi:hypothetical protein
MIDILRQDRSRAREQLVHNFSPYYLCDHFFGDEIHKLENIRIETKSNDLLRTQAFSSIKDFDIIYVQVNFFELFCSQVLDKLRRKIVLMTGQYNSPQILRSSLSERVLNHPTVVLWISQNPIYRDHPKYIPFPYGVEYYAIDSYAKVLVSHDGVKTNKVKYLPVSTNTHPCRFSLPVLPKLLPYDFFTQLADTHFVISPIGDRDDCYRHWEAIGLGTIPISNINKPLYETLFSNSMKYSTIEEITEIVNTESLDDAYVEPNRALVCFDYHKKRVLDAINAIKNS